MKKIVAMGVCLGVLLVFSGSAQAATGGRFFFGAFAEMGKCLSYEGLGFGGEVGFAVSDLVSLVAEGATGKLSLVSSGENSYSSYRDEMKMSVTPFGFSIHFTAPLGDRVQPYVGVGIAYQSVKLTYTSTSEYTYYGGSEKETGTETYDLHALSPMFKLGVAVALTDHIRVVGEYQQMLAKDKIEYEGSHSSSYNEVFFGSSNVRFGIRIVL